jgi:hypothetical protein
MATLSPEAVALLRSIVDSISPTVADRPIHMFRVGGPSQQHYQSLFDADMIQYLYSTKAHNGDTEYIVGAITVTEAGIALAQQPITKPKVARPIPQ